MERGGNTEKGSFSPQNSEYGSIHSDQGFQYLLK